MQDNGTTDVIFIIRKVEEKHQAKKKLYYAFVDLENKFDKSPERGFEMGFEEYGCG